MRVCYVYWAHLPEHTDLLVDGYIGVTVQGIDKRFKDHLWAAENGSKTIFANAIRKYGNKIIVEPILKADEDYCYAVEARLRPGNKIGWNTVPGGIKSPRFLGGVHTEEAKRKISEASKRTCQSEAHKIARAKKVGYKHTEETKEKMSQQMKGKYDPWNSARSNKVVWLNAQKVYELFIETGFGYIKLEKIFGYKIYTLRAMYLKFKKQNWNPEKDSKWVRWVEETQKDISK